MVKNRDRFLLLNECEFSINALWKSLIWFYSYFYFVRVWAIQKMNVNKKRLLYCSFKKIVWDQINLVAGYIIIEIAFFKSFGFSNMYC